MQLIKVANYVAPSPNSPSPNSTVTQFQLKITYFYSNFNLGTNNNLTIVWGKKMSPTIFREGNKRYFFFSREEARMHVHILSPKGEAKFWLEPIVSLEDYNGFSSAELKHIEK